jgi:hypothetical protein
MYMKEFENSTVCSKSSQVKSVNKIFMNVASRLLKDVSFKFVCKMRGLFNKIFFNAASRLLKDVS